MDQSHRPYIHSTYSDELRISIGENFANSLTKWGNWPFFLNVMDVRVKEGQYYQTFTIGGLIYVHTVIEMGYIDDSKSLLDINWHISSHWFLKPIHKYLNNKLYKLNKNKEKFKNAQLVENLGFFIGLNTKKINSKLAEYISTNLLMINEI